MRKFLLVPALAASLAAWSQKAANPTTFANAITPEDLKKYEYIIASKEMEGRETATEGQRKASVYIESQFKSFGLVPGNNGNYQLTYPVFQDSLVKASLEVNGKAFQLDKDFGVNMGTANTSTLMGGEVVFVGYGISDSTRDDYKGINARGKIVLILAGNPPSANQGNAGGGRGRNFGFGILDAAAKNGAAAILQVAINFPRKAGNTKGNQYINGFRRTNYPNTFQVSEDVALAIMGSDYSAAKDAMKNGNLQPKSYLANVMMDFNKSTLQLQSTDVIGYIPGTDKKDEYVFITGHYDHLGKRDTVIYYGADDDGSGTCSVMELAKAYSQAKAAGKGPRRTMVFMTVSGEEKGLWGSAYYTDHPLFPLEKTTVDLNIDMIGRIDPNRKQGDSTNYVYVVGDDKLSSDLHPISEAQNNKFTKMELDYKFNDPKDPQRIYFRSDHYNFARKGTPIIFYFDGIHNDYHRPTDTPDKINYDLLAKRAKLVFYTAWDMANRDEMLKRDIPLENQ